MLDKIRYICSFPVPLQRDRELQKKKGKSHAGHQSQGGEQIGRSDIPCGMVPVAKDCWRSISAKCRDLPYRQEGAYEVAGLGR